MINLTSNGENWKAYQVALSKPSKLALEQEEYLLYWLLWQNRTSFALMVEVASKGFAGGSLSEYA